MKFLFSRVSLPCLLLVPRHQYTAQGHGLLAKPPSKNAGTLTTSVDDTGTYYSIASFGIIDKAFFDGDHSITPWNRPGHFDYALARDVVPGHPQTLHPCGCNAGGVAQCVGVEIATGFGETTLGAAPGVPPTFVPPLWSSGSPQEVGWNAYANHAGGYIYTLCKKTDYDACRDVHMPDGPHAADEQQTSAYLECVWSCFEATTLDWVPDSQKVQYRDEACTFASTDPLTKVGKDGHIWRATPIPDQGQVTNGGEGRCTWDSVVGFSSTYAEEKFTSSFGTNTSDVCDFGRDQRSTKDWHIMDKVQIPAGLPEGEYLLGWRWDAYMADQMWTGCADVWIVPSSLPVSSSELDCPTPPPSASTNPPPTNPPPTNPPPTNPPPTNPPSTNPSPTDPPPTDPSPTNSYPTNPPPTYPPPTDPSPTNSYPTNPPPTDPSPTNPPLTDPSPTISPPTSTPPPNNECSDFILQGNWGADGRTCDTYEDHGGPAYCAHAEIAEKCCFCGGGDGPPPTSTPPPPGGCSDFVLTGNWGAGGNSCDTYESHGGSAYCAHAELAAKCCFCGGGDNTNPSRHRNLRPMQTPMVPAMHSS